MKRYLMLVEMEDDKLTEIFDKIREAEQTIYKCYKDLCELGVLKIKEQATDDSQ